MKGYIPDQSSSSILHLEEENPITNMLPLLLKVVRKLGILSASSLNRGMSTAYSKLTSESPFRRSLSEKSNDDKSFISTSIPTKNLNKSE